MTLLMRDRENIKLGKVENLVSLIRDVEEKEIESAAKFLKVDIGYISYVQSVINEHPEMDDEEIAEIVIDY